ncbi:uncharacterized protein LOC128627269 [Artibeus jamaicensis]|uniref:uncharacterized protein LOC128627269 n=1 Tax=Artibeus jamaicensis TaxID=9417 RepID=UPI00235A976B|nr:uncharacterized protein LOC128627269 [Artibeus jamaicensis]
MEAYRVYTPLDPEAEENRRLVNIAFVTQAASDIRKKLQKIEGFEGENRSKLLEIAQKVYVNRDDPKKPGTRDYQLIQDLREVNLRYVDDLLVAAEGAKDCKAATIDLLQDLEQKGYRVSAKKAQIVTQTVSYLGFEQALPVICSREEGGSTWGTHQELGPWKRPVAYLSKKLDPVASGWPTCLRALAATSVLVKEASKLTLGQDIQVIGEHYIEQVLRAPPDRWLTNARLTQYQAQLLNPPAVQFLKTTALNPATLLPIPDSTLIHSCSQILETVTGSRPDLKDQAYEKVDLTLFTDGSSFIKDGQRYAGVAVTTEDKVLWQETLPPGTSAQKAELIGLTKALQIAEGKAANIYTDSRYAFATAHIHGDIYKERGLLTAGGKDIKNRNEILALLDAIWLPSKVAMIHCKGHQKGESPVIRGNHLTDSTAKEAATKKQPRSNHTYFPLWRPRPCQQTLATSQKKKEEERNEEDRRTPRDG